MGVRLSEKNTKGKKKMNISKNKKIQTAISVILILSMIASIAFVSADVVNVNGKTLIVGKIHTWLYVGTSAGGGGVADVGVGQQMLITAWTKDIPPDIGETANLISTPDGRAGWNGITITVTRPDNTTETLNMGYSDPVGNNYKTYTPDQAGTYHIQAHFPETWKNSTNPTESHETGYPNLAATLYSAADSPVETFTVTNSPTPAFPESPLPNDYWTRPVSGASRDWWVLMGNKLGGASGVWPNGGSGGTVGSYFYGDSPLSAHILWTKPYTIGGSMDARFNDSVNGDYQVPSETFETTHYQGVSFTASLIIDGKIYCSPRATDNYNSGVQVINLYTGETMYQNYTDIPPSFGSIYEYNSPNQMGGFAYIWKTNQAATTILGAGGGTIDIVPQIVDLANATENAQCQVTKAGNDYTYNRTSGKIIASGGTPIASANQISATVNFGTTVWEMFDASTMTPITWIANVSSSGTQVYGKDGSLTFYNIVNKGTATNPNYYLTIWNSSAGTMVAAPDGTGYWQYRPAGGQFGAAGTYWQTATAITNAVHDGNNFYSENISIPSIVGPVPSMENGTIQCIREGQFMIIGTQGWQNETGVYKGWMMGVGLAPDNMGKKLWETTYTPPLALASLNVSKPAAFTGGLGLTGVYPEDGVITWADPQTCQRWVYDLYTGQLLWTSPPENQYEYYGISQTVFNHMLLGYGNYGGQIIAYNIRTGQQLWNYTAENVGFESPYGNYPMTIGAVDGYNDVIYTVTSEHHNIQPMYRGDNLRCINASNGQEIWKILCFGSGISIADGILLKGNNLDNMIYAFGKGPSATTVCASNDVSTLGTPVMVKGTVTDQTTTGRRNTNDQVDFTLQGTPAISDASMQSWMEYKFEQQAKPTNATGVPVELTAIDPNGNYVTLGTATSDMNGNYALPYTPQVPGMYTIFANFKGTNSYGPSSATAYIDVSNAAVTPTIAPTPLATSVADQYFIPAIAGLFVLIIIVAIVLALLMLRKK